MPKVYISPSDQGKNVYAAGNTNEEAQCERIAVATEKALIRCGFEVKNNMTSSMYERVQESNEWKADIHLPIHTNGFNAKVTGTRLMSFDLNGDGYKACVSVFKYLAPITPGTSENITAHPELYEVRAANAPTVYVEVDFHDVPDIALWIIANSEAIAEAICKGLCEYFNITYVQANAEEETLDIGKGNDWSVEGRTFAVEKGIIRGKGYNADGSIDFDWDANVTREELAVILKRFEDNTKAM